MIFSLAYAQSTGGGGGGMLIQLLPLILIFVVFYFFLIRPQQKRVKEHKDMVTALKVGNKITSTGGIIGKIIKLDNDQVISIEISDNVIVKLKRDNVVEVNNEDVKKQ